jgi:hypothetical protein
VIASGAAYQSRPGALCLLSGSSPGQGTIGTGMIAMAAEFTRMPPAQNVLLESPAASDGGAAGMPFAPAPASGRPPIDVRRLRHPSEPSRFAFAAASSILLIGLGLLLLARLAGFFWLAVTGAVVLFALGSWSTTSTRPPPT